MEGHACAEPEILMLMVDVSDLDHALNNANVLVHPHVAGVFLGMCLTGRW